MMTKIKEHTCNACLGTGYPVVMQPVQPGRKIYPVKCQACDGKGKITDTTEATLLPYLNVSGPRSAIEDRLPATCALVRAPTWHTTKDSRQLLDAARLFSPGGPAQCSFEESTPS